METLQTFEKYIPDTMTGNFFFRATALATARPVCKE